MISNSEAITIRKFDIALNNQNPGAIKDLVVQLQDRLNTEEVTAYSNIQQWQDIYYRITTSSYLDDNSKTFATNVVGAVVEKTGKKRFALHQLKLTILAQENYSLKELLSSIGDKELTEKEIQSITDFWKHLSRAKDNFIKSRLDSRFLEITPAIHNFLKKREKENREFFAPVFNLLSELDIEYELIYTSPDDAVSVFRDDIGRVNLAKLSINQLNGSIYWLECSKCGDIEKRLYGIGSHYCEACGGLSYPYVQDTSSHTWQKSYATSLFKAYRSPNVLLLYPNKDNIQNLLPFIEESEYGEDQYLGIITTKDDLGWIKDSLGHIKYNICTQNNISDLIEEIRLRCLSVHSVDYLQTR